MHMLHCNPTHFREELETDHQFQVFMKKRGIPWFFHGPRPLSQPQRERFDTDWSVCIRCGKSEEWKGFDRQYHMVSCDPVFYKGALVRDMEFQQHLESQGLPRGRRRAPVKIGAKTKSEHPATMNCSCGLDMFVGDCLQCEVCNQWTHKFCEGVNIPAFDKTRKSSVGFVCYACSKDPTSWSQWDECVVGSKTSHSYSEVVARLELEAAESELPQFPGYVPKPAVPQVTDTTPLDNQEPSLPPEPPPSPPADDTHGADPHTQDPPPAQATSAPHRQQRIAESEAVVTGETHGGAFLPAHRDR